MAAATRPSTARKRRGVARVHREHEVAAEAFRRDALVAAESGERLGAGQLRVDGADEPGSDPDRDGQVSGRGGGVGLVEHGSAERGQSLAELGARRA